jgi:NTP pyrophosphatase (non-canonical NTP hydrolase)
MSSIERHGLRYTAAMEELKKALREFIAERDWDQFHSPKNLAMALSVEVAELVEIFQWLTEEQSRNPEPDVRAAAGEEIADVLIYLLQISHQLGLDPLDEARRKLEKNREKYPAERVRGLAKKYSEYR